MNSRERILATFYGEKVDKIPVDAWWSEEIYKRIKLEKGVNPNIYYNLDTRRLCIEAPSLKNEWKEFLQLNKDDIKIYEYPFPDKEMAETNINNLGSKIRRIKKEGYPAIGHIGSVCFEAAWGLMGMENFFMSIYDNYDILDDITDKISDIKLDMAMQFVKNGIDIIHMGDDFGAQKGLLISKVKWKRLIMPKIEKIIKAVKMVNKDCLVFFHSDGDIYDIIEDFINIGVDFFNPIQPECMDISEVEKKFSNKIAFWGGIGSQSTLYLKKDKISESVKNTINILGRGKRFVISPTHMIQGNVPIENIDYFFEAIGYYGSN